MATLQPPKGFRDFLPQQMLIRNHVTSLLSHFFEAYGFQPLQTPTVEYADLLLNKGGLETDKLLYTFTDRGGRHLGLNYDLTVPTARILAQYPTLEKPFKRYQIQSAYRAENTQKGRYRQFTQCDIDIFGSNDCLADAEILTLTSQALTALGFNNFQLKINSRPLLFHLLEQVQIPPSQHLSVLQSIDKLDKKTPSEVEVELANQNLSSSQIKTLFSLIKKATPDTHLKQIFTLAQKMGAINLHFTPFLVRGLDYYTGPIFETVIENSSISGSITGGGRYDKLIKQLGGPDIPAVGSTFGLDRICDLLENNSKFNSTAITQILVTVFSPATLNHSLDLSRQLREINLNTEIYLSSSTDLNKQLKYANQKNIPYVAILGPDEINHSTVTLKNLRTHSQKQYPLNKLSDLFQDVTAPLPPF